MFWGAVWDGVGLLLNVKFLAVLLGAASIQFFMAYFQIFINEKPKAVAFLGIISMAVIDVAVVALAVLALLPLFYHGSQYLPYEFFIMSAPYVLKGAFAAAVLLFLISFIPILGGLVGTCPGFFYFFIGVNVFHSGTRTFLKALSIPVEQIGAMFPSFWTALGFLCVSTVITFIPLAIVTMAMRSREEEEPTGSMLVLSQGWLKYSSLLGVGMYGFYTSSNLQKIIGQ